MAKKAKKRVAKRKAVRAKAKAKRSVARKAKAPRRVAKAARKPAPRKASGSSAVRARDDERKRLLREERALERDVDNEEEPSSLRESPEFIPGAEEDDLAEELGEAAVESATSGGQAAEDYRDEDLDEEEGGPFVTTSGRQEFARGTDASNPEDAEPADFPTATSRPR